jgi:hypothetical protein
MPVWLRRGPTPCSFEFTSRVCNVQVKVRASGACNTGAASLCAPRTSAADDSALLLATSPVAFDLRDPKQTGGFKVLTPVLDQLECNTCTAFAVAAAAGKQGDAYASA